MVLRDLKVDFTNCTVTNNEYNEIPETIWQIIIKYFDDKKILEFIMHRDCDGDNLLCYAV